ncbi:SusC/RagA family TonB-linked outer membrane protein [Asinibacterium sp. OR53]|uniref:SusC/RagA family TonB-linked outer membrane protein n=1 Tax=Asinibacterium sp. OR53 TaxID=925409 RepID=UPI00047A9553|nr:SusC/RagA family TonB-linked outer membrane protein [Asinibacterium sp. OR53]
MRKWKLFSLVMLVFMSMMTNNLVAQGVPISGTVLADDGTPLAGVTVTVSGTNRSAVTDDKGKFTINASKNATLQFSYVGYTTQKVKATAGMQVSLAKDTAQLNDVVVTAMGIKKERKALGYSVTDLNAQELMKNKNTNVVNSLAGKVPGVNITQFSGSAGAGASITIRGGNSTSEGRQNQPLFVIDGVIYDNSTTVTGNTGTDGLSRSNTTFSNRIMDVNPEDVESLSVLKGAAAAALYGSRAADGVVIITTKKGAEGVVKVNATSKVSTSWANKLPEVQTQFGNGVYSSNGVLNNISYSNWGQKLTSADTLYNNIGNFFQNGIVYDNNVNVSGGSKNGSFFLSGSNFDQTGIVPNTKYDKTTFRFNGEQKYGALTLNANVAYSIANINRTLTTAGLYGSGVGSMQSLYTFPQTFNIKNYLNPDGSQHRIFAGTLPLENDIDNPYWIINKDNLTSQTKRITGGINGTYKIAKWWDVIARLGYDQYSTNDYTYIAPGSALAPLYQNGRLSKDLYDYRYITTTVMSNLHKTFGDFDTHLMLGTTSENTLISNQNHWGYNFITAGTISFNNMASTNKFFTDGTTRKRLVGAYGEVGASYRNIAFLTVTSRNDWSSTLPLENNSYFYPSVSGSFVFTELLPKNNILSFGKVRASWARVGKDANAYATNTYVNPPISIGGYTGIGNQYYSGNPYLIPEIQNSWEVGGELRFLNGRIGLDYTYYHSETENQIGQPRLAQSGGFIFSTLNSGSVLNTGMEIAVTGKPIVTRDFTWDATLNFSYNKGRLGAFIPGVAYFYPTDAQFGTIKAASIPNGGYFLGMTGQPYLRELDAKGVEIPNGRYQVDPSTGFYKLNTTNPVVGNREPSWIGGFNNTFRYKKFALSFLLDIRKGGDVFNGTAYAMVTNGLSKLTTQNGRQSVTVSGVNSLTGADFNQTYTAGQSYVINGTTYSGNYLIQQYWQNYAANSYNFITSVNWVKLRSLSLSYDFSDYFKNKKIIKGLTATAVGTNLFTWTNYKGMDPEVSAAGGTGGSGSTGIDYLGVPATASFTFGVNIMF